MTKKVTTITLFRNIAKAGDKVPPSTVFSHEDVSRPLSKRCECFFSEIMANYLVHINDISHVKPLSKIIWYCFLVGFPKESICLRIC